MSALSHGKTGTITPPGSHSPRSAPEPWWTGWEETSFLGRVIVMPQQYARELPEPAVRLMAEHRGEYDIEYAASRLLAAKLGIATPEALRQWVR